MTGRAAHRRIQQGLLPIDLGTLSERDKQRLTLLNPVNQAPVPYAKLVQTLELGFLQGQRGMLGEWRTVQLSKPTFDVLLDVLVETVEPRDEVVEIEDLRYFRERGLFEKYAS